MYRKPEQCKSGDPACMGGLYGKNRRYPSHRGNERKIPKTEGNDRTDICGCKGKTRNEIYPVQRISKGEDGAEPLIRLYESKENGSLEMAYKVEQEIPLFLFSKSLFKGGKNNYG